MSIREAEVRFLKRDVQRVKDLLFSPEDPVIEPTSSVSTYFKNAWYCLCAKLESYERATQNVALYQQLAEHDRHFSDGDSSKQTIERDLLQQQIRGGEEVILQNERKIEGLVLIDSQTRQRVEEFMNYWEFDKDDSLRPSIFLKEPRQWSEPELGQLNAAVTSWNAKTDACESQSKDRVYYDFKTFLGLVSKEVELTNHYIKVTQQFDHKLAELRCHKGDPAETNSAFILGRLLFHEIITAAQYAEEIEKLNTTYFPQSMADDVVQYLSRSRAAVTTEIDNLRSQITERSGIFLSALNAWAVPQTSILRNALYSDTTKQPESEEGTKKGKTVPKDRMFVLVIGKWWEKWHVNGGNFTNEAWDDLDRLMLRNGMSLLAFLDSKPAIKKLVNALNSTKSRKDIITTWEKLIPALKTGERTTIALRRILLQRFWEIHKEQYLPFQQSKKHPSSH